MPTNNLAKVVTDAQKDKKLFVELLSDADNALATRNISLSVEDKKVLNASLNKIRENVAAEFARARVIAAGGKSVADGIIGW